MKNLPREEIEIMARRMNSGQHVGEGWLYGVLAVELEQSGLVATERLKEYRSGAFLARKQIYGLASALQWEREAQDRHASAERAFITERNARHAH